MEIMGWNGLGWAGLGMTSIIRDLTDVEVGRTSGLEGDMFRIDNGWRWFRHSDGALGTVCGFTCCKDDGLSSLALSIFTRGYLLAFRDRQRDLTEGGTFLCVR